MDIINGEYRPGVLFKGSDIFGQKNEGSQIFRRKFKESQINFKISPIFFKISIFLEDMDPNIPKIVKISDDKIKKWQILKPHSRKFPRKYD